MADAQKEPEPRKAETAKKRMRPGIWTLNILLGAALGLGGWYLFDELRARALEPALWILVIGLIASLLLAAELVPRLRPRATTGEPDRRWRALAIVLLIAGLFLAVLGGQLNSAQAVVLAFLGAGALFALAELIDVLRKGEQVRFETHSGGLGGGLGGWTVSTPLVLLITVLGLTAAFGITGYRFLQPPPPAQVQADSETASEPAAEPADEAAGDEAQ